MRRETQDTRCPGSAVGVVSAWCVVSLLSGVAGVCMKVMVMLVDDLMAHLH